MDDRRLESILRAGPTDEPLYRGDIGGRLRAERDVGDAGETVIALVTTDPTRATRQRWLLPAAAAIVVMAVAAGLVLTLDGDEPPRVSMPVVRDPGALVDRWVGPPRGDATGAAFVDFREGGTFNYVTGNPTQPTRWGSTWSVDDGLLTLSLISEESGCPQGALGRYRWEGPPERTLLTLSLVDDECARRAEEIDGVWTHTACPVGGSDCLGPVDAGTYASVTFDPFGTNRYGQLAYSLPSGWAVTADSRAQLSLRPADDAARVGIDVWADVAVATAGCDGAPETAAVGALAIADALAGLDGLDTSRSDATVDGRDAQVVDAETTETWPQVCPDEGDGPFVALLASRTGIPVSWAVGVSAGEPVRVILVDVAAGRTTAVVIRGAVEDADSIIDSFRFTDVSQTP